MKTQEAADKYVSEHESDIEIYKQLNKISEVLSDRNKVIQYYTENNDIPLDERKKIIKDISDGNLEMIEKVTSSIIKRRKSKQNKPGTRYTPPIISQPNKPKQPTSWIGYQ